MGCEPIWRWSAQTADGARGASSLDALPVSAGRLRDLAIAAEPEVPFVPELEVHLAILQGAHDGRSIVEIADHLRARWPNHFATSAFATASVERYLDRYRTRVVLRRSAWRSDGHVNDDEVLEATAVLPEHVLLPRQCRRRKLTGTATFVDNAAARCSQDRELITNGFVR